MKSSLAISTILVLSLWMVSCSSQEPIDASPSVDTPATQTALPAYNVAMDPTQSADSMIDPRDGAQYATVRIGELRWMAENLRYHAAGSLLNPDNPSISYGRLYDALTAQTACPEGWRLPTDREWNEMELSLGMLPADTASTTWRGMHGLQLKSATGWDIGNSINGTNSSGFNGYPAGYYFWGDEPEMGGLGTSAGFWCQADSSKAWLRFLGGPMDGVNRFPDDLPSAFMVGCRCVQRR